MVEIKTILDSRFSSNFVIEGKTDDDCETLCSALYDIVGKAIAQGFEPDKIKAALSYAETPIMLKEKREQVRKLRS